MFERVGVERDREREREARDGNLDELGARARIDHGDRRSAWRRYWTSVAISRRSGETPTSSCPTATAGPGMRAPVRVSNVSIALCLVTFVVVSPRPSQGPRDATELTCAAVGREHDRGLERVDDRVERALLCVQPPPERRGRHIDELDREAVARVVDRDRELRAVGRKGNAVRQAGKRQLGADSTPVREVPYVESRRVARRTPPRPDRGRTPRNPRRDRAPDAAGHLRSGGRLPAERGVFAAGPTTRRRSRDGAAKIPALLTATFGRRIAPHTRAREAAAAPDRSWRSRPGSRRRRSSTRRTPRSASSPSMSPSRADHRGTPQPMGSP